MQLNADLKSVDEDKDRVFAKLDDEVKAKEDLLGEFVQLRLMCGRPKMQLAERSFITSAEIRSMTIVMIVWFLVSIKEMETEKFSLQSDSDNYSNQVTDLNHVLVTLLFSCTGLNSASEILYPNCHVKVQRLQQKLQIMTEMYQENEMKLHR